MAGLRGNNAWLMAAKQTQKGTAASVGAGAYKNPFVGGSIGPVRETDNLSETDASRDQGTTYTVQSGVEGEPEVYVRADSIGFWLAMAFGTVQSSSASGSGSGSGSGGGDYQHVITPGNTLPYFTAWRMISDTLWERFEDCKAGSISISAEAGQPLTATIGIQGRTPVRLTTNPDAGDTVPLANQQVMSFNNASVTLGGAATSLVSSFELTLENNVSRQQTDDVTPYDVVEGLREITLGFDMVFEDLTEYNKFHYGGAAGTAVSSDIFTTDANFTFTLSNGEELAFDLPRIAYQEFPVEPDPGGDPITVSVRAVGQRGSTPIVTATLKNSVASY
jgi:hypothetical protein